MERRGNPRALVDTTMRSLFVASLVASSLAHAQPPADVPVGAPAEGVSTSFENKVRVGIAVNPPVRWVTEDKAFGASLYVGFARHHVIRANVARYPYGDELPIGEATFDGTTTDLGASYMYFPRRAFDGFVVEAGLVYRNEDGVAHGPFWDDTTEKTRFYGGRAMLGWSWLLSDRLFTSVQAGASIGHVRGTESLCDSGCMDYGDKPVTTRVSDMTFAPEAMIRIGVAFDL